MVVTLLIQVFLATLTRTNANELITSHVSSTYDWDSRSSPVKAPCVKIPRNLSLCSNMDYTEMRLPNLLEHETLHEISQQAASWIPLLNIRCHPDTQRFICSLFCPICLDHAIYPCRSLCEKVKAGCEKHMMSYGYPWPPMFDCHKFPADNNMCVKSQSATEASSEDRCRMCEQVNTVENILNNFCQSSFAIRVKMKKRDENQFTFKVAKVFKSEEKNRKIMADELLHLNLRSDCCNDKIKTHGSYFVMGTYKDGIVNPTFIMPWVVKKSKPFKKSIRMLKTLDCSNVDAITQTVIDPSTSVSEKVVKILPSTNKSESSKSRRKGRNRKKDNRRQRKNKLHDDTH